MIITRTPFRISFAGGGTDLREFYSKEPGKVLSTSIKNYIYVVVKRQLGIVEYKYRINWSQVEFSNSIDEIQHPIVREALRLFKIDFPLEITTFTDIPGQTGLGSSSAFSVGLVHALYALKGKMVTKHILASEAAKIEVDILGRTMGKQDHYAASYGNINIFTFTADEIVSVDPVLYDSKVKDKIQRHLMLFYLKSKRNASQILEDQDKRTEKIRTYLRQMQQLVEPLNHIFSTGDNLEKFGQFLDQGWQIKRQLTGNITSKEIDGYYQAAMNAGASGGKLLGAGGGGFLLFFVGLDSQNKVKNALKDLYYLPVEFDNAGTRITYYDNS